MACALHFWLGICVNSPLMSEQSACAMLVLPTPDGPTNSHADGYGALANLARMRLGLSNPTNSATVRGRYFSLRLTGNAKEGALIARPLGYSRRPFAPAMRPIRPCAHRS